MRELFQKIKLPLFISLFFVVLLLAWKILDLPSDETLVGLAREYFTKYGVVTVFFAAIIEGALFTGWYAPGGLVIFLGVILSPTPVVALYSILATVGGFTIAYISNFFIGRYGWYNAFLILGLRRALVQAQETFRKRGFHAIYLSYWEPNLASLTSTAAGIAQSSFGRFFRASFIATLWWGAFWGTLAYIFGQKILEYLGAVFFAAMIGWISWILFTHYRKKRITHLVR